MALAALLLLIGGSYLVYAAMTASDRKENDFQIGQVETKIFEENFEEDLTETVKDQSRPKEVRIQNKGTIKQFVRVMVLPEVRTGIAGDDQNEQVLPLKIGTDIILEEMVTADWIDGEDGYYYYIKEAVKPNEFTSYLFKKVKLSDQLGSQYNQANLSITLKVEAVNCAEAAYRDAWWQGATPTESPLKEVEDALNTEVED
ncbi:hypothetical protein RV10_GL004916 [Enterococcus pallens]|nr:hypothetical protein RV10_GL004916 [Enterococcus pallens]